MSHSVTLNSSTLRLFNYRWFRTRDWTGFRDFLQSWSRPRLDRVWTRSRLGLEGVWTRSRLGLEGVWTRSRLGLEGVWTRSRLGHSTSPIILHQGRCCRQ
ncbi:hypothetical protein NL108_018547 [Boleophthalmus pectinirostris]|nr:hypothetical protein NL108_018547 [Boleophthalmus pectinirostris]